MSTCVSRSTLVGGGSKFTQRFRPVRVAELDVTPLMSCQEVLEFENDMTLRYMERMIREHGPEGWRAVCGGTWCKLDQEMPAELRRRLAANPPDS